LIPSTIQVLGKVFLSKELNMKIAVLGTGMVGQTLASALAAKGHDVVIGTRDVASTLASTQPNGYGMPAFGVWHQAHNSIRVTSFADAAKWAELLVNATNGGSSLQALEQAKAGSVGNKVLIDVANDLDFSKGMPPVSRSSDFAGTGLAEKIQNAFPNLHVVKTLNTMNALVMLNPARVAGGDSTVFMSGNNAGAKATVKDMLQSFGWQDILDLGDISSSRAVEMLMPIWLRVYGVLGQTPYNFKIVR
jgi:8-hydroxy-5-deazaflavin:NADPH oxidoreductase